MIPSTRSLKNPAPARLRMPRRETAPEIFDQFRDRLSESLANDLPPIDELSTNAGYDRLLGYCDAKFITASNSSFSYKAKRQGKPRTRARIGSYMRCYRAPLEDDWTPLRGAAENRMEAFLPIGGMLNLNGIGLSRKSAET